METGNGMSGAIVIEGIGAEAPHVVGMRERLLILRDSYIDTDEAAAAVAVAGLEPAARV